MPNSATSQGQLQRSSVKRLVTDKRGLTREGGPGSGPHKKLAHVASQLKDIDHEDLSTAEKNILGHLKGAKANPQKAIAKIQDELHGIDYQDLSTAERNITNILGNKSHESRAKESVKRIRESFMGTLIEEGEDENQKAKGTGEGAKKGRVYLVTIIEEGLGNSKDKNYYSGEALKGGIKTFDGAKAYADHPDAITEKTLPERSMKDLVGWYSDCFTDQNPKTGKIRLRGKLHFFPSAKWLTDMVDAILTDPTAKGLFGISINAVGKTRPSTVDGEQVNYVEEFQRVDSADVVTEPAARGRFDKMLESQRSVAGRRSRKKVTNSVKVLTSKRAREAAALSPESAKEVADSLTSAYSSDNPDELKQAVFEAAKKLYSVASISGKGSGQANEEQTSNTIPSGGSTEMSKNTKMKASTGKRGFRKGKTLRAAAGKGEDGETIDEPDPEDIEDELEESEVEDEEGDSDLGAQEDFGGGGKHHTKESLEDEEGLEGEEDEAGGMPGQGVGAPAGGGAPGSSRTVASADDGSDDDMDLDGDSGSDDDDDEMDEAFEDEGGGQEMRPGTVAESRGRNSRNRRRTHEASASTQGRTVPSAKLDGGLGNSGQKALPKGADPSRGYDDSDEDFGKKDDSTSGVGKSYKIKTSRFSRNRQARRVVHEANRRIDILEDKVFRLRESRKAAIQRADRYQGIVQFNESKVRGNRLLREAVNKEILPEGYAISLSSKIAGLTEREQIREIKSHARLLESATEGAVSRLTESVDGNGARGGVASYVRTAEADSELTSGLAEAGVPMKQR